MAANRKIVTKQLTGTTGTKQISGSCRFSFPTEWFPGSCGQNNGNAFGLCARTQHNRADFAKQTWYFFNVSISDRAHLEFAKDFVRSANQEMSLLALDKD